MASVLKVDKLDPQSGTALEIGTSGDTITVPSGATLDISSATLTPPATLPASSGVNLTALNATNLGSGTVPTARLGTGTASSSTVLYGDQTYKAEPTGATNTPYFHMKAPTGTQTITEDSWTKVILSTSVLDSGSGVDTTNYKYVIPSGEGGVWHIYGQVSYYYSNSDWGATYFKLTGTTEITQNLPFVFATDQDGRHGTFGYSVIHNFSAGDEISIYVYMQALDGTTCAVYPALTNSVNMMGYKLAV